MGLGIGAIIGLAKEIGKFLVKHKKYWWILLVLAIVAQAKVNHSLKAKLNKYEGGSLELKDGEVAKVRIGGSGVETVKKDGDGVKRTKDFRAPEARTDVVIREDPEVKAKLAALNKRITNMLGAKDRDEEAIKKLLAEREALQLNLLKIDVDVQKWGFVFKPGIGAIYSSKLYPEGDIKFLFVHRYSIKVGFTQEFVDVGLTRHIDDLLPAPFNFRNLEVQVVGGARYKNFKDFIIGVGIRLNL